MHVSVGQVGVAAVAAVARGHSAGDDDLCDGEIVSIIAVFLLWNFDYLWRDVYVWPGGLPGDLDPVREGGGGGEGPAGAAVVREVLVTDLN